MHVVDVSHTGFEEQIEVVNNTLSEIKANDKPILLVFNKIDDLKEPLSQDTFADTEETPYIDRLKNTWMAKENASVIFISAEKKINIIELRKVLVEMVLATNSSK